jgi:hypothetical protein
MVIHVQIVEIKVSFVMAKIATTLVELSIKGTWCLLG